MKRGPCRLCGCVGPRTVTHVPAKSAGNVGTRQEAVIEVAANGERIYGLGPERDGGMNGYWFCVTCNRDRTRPWDEEYTRWVPSLFNILHDPRNKGDTISMVAVDFDPGAFARCLWAWFLAVAEGLRERVPEVAAALITGKPVTETNDRRLFLAATRELQFSVFMGRFGGGVTAPPYVAFLAGPYTQHLARGWLDTTPWLAERPGQRRTVSLTLPIVETLGDKPMPMLGHPLLD